MLSTSEKRSRDDGGCHLRVPDAARAIHTLSVDLYLVIGAFLDGLSLYRLLTCAKSIAAAAPKTKLDLLLHMQHASVFSPSVSLNPLPEVCGIQEYRHRLRLGANWARGKCKQSSPQCDYLLNHPLSPPTALAVLDDTVVIGFSDGFVVLQHLVNGETHSFPLFTFDYAHVLHLFNSSASRPLIAAFGERSSDIAVCDTRGAIRIRFPFPAASDFVPMFAGGYVLECQRSFATGSNVAVVYDILHGELVHRFQFSAGYCFASAAISFKGDLLLYISDVATDQVRCYNVLKEQLLFCASIGQCVMPLRGMLAAVWASRLHLVLWHHLATMACLLRLWKSRRGSSLHWLCAHPLLYL